VDEELRHRAAAPVVHHRPGGLALLEHLAQGLADRVPGDVTEGRGEGIPHCSLSA